MLTARGYPMTGHRGGLSEGYPAGGGDVDEVGVKAIDEGAPRHTVVKADMYEKEW
jgi:hypothetical protein